MKLPPLFWMSCPEVTAVASERTEGEGVAVGVGVVGEHVKGDTGGVVLVDRHGVARLPRAGRVGR